MLRDSVRGESFYVTGPQDKQLPSIPGDLSSHISTGSDDLPSSVLSELNSLLLLICEVHDEQGTLFEDVFPLDSNLISGDRCIHSISLICNEHCQVVATAYHYVVCHDGFPDSLSDC